MFFFCFRSLMLTWTLIDQALHYQQTVYSILYSKHTDKEILSYILTKQKLLINNTSEKLVRFYLSYSFTFAKVNQNKKDHVIHVIQVTFSFT